MMKKNIIKFNKLTIGALALSMSLFAFAGCAAAENSAGNDSVANGSNANGNSQDNEKETITIQSYNANKELVDLEVPYDPQRIAILDMASLDIIDALDLGDRVVGSASVSIEYLSDYNPDTNDEIANLGTIKTADLVEVAACEPDIIFIGGRLASIYNDLSEIAPVVYLATDTKVGVVESTANNAKTIASVFGKEAEIEELVAGFDARIEAMKSKYSETNAVIGMFSGANFNVLGNDGRCSIIGREIGFHNLGVESADVTATHGNEASWETIVKLNPEYIFVLDRNSAINSTEGNPAAKDAIENELIQELDCYKNGNIIYLEHGNVWYTAEGGIQALDTMLEDLEKYLME